MVIINGKVRGGEFVPRAWDSGDEVMLPCAGAPAKNAIERRTGGIVNVIGFVSATAKLKFEIAVPPNVFHQVPW